MIAWILGNWKELALAAIIAALIWFGHEATVLWQYRAENVSLKQQLAQSQRAQTDMAKFNQDLAKVNLNEKDPCITSPMPLSYRKLR